MFRRIGAVLALSGVLAWAVPAACEPVERILAFDSHITVHADASMTVRETITVRSAAQAIRRGIYRDFPSEYRDPLGHRYLVEFTVLEALRDGRSEHWRAEPQSNGVRVYLGHPDVFLPLGEYTYELTYRTSRQVGFFDNHDELYWNVTGTGWIFPIDQAGAVVTLPAGVSSEDLRLEAYTGPQGAQGRAYEAESHGDTIRFRTTAPLGPHEGLTIVVGFPKGIVAEPSAATRAEWVLRDNRSLVVGLFGLALVFVYYLVTWKRVGDDPERGTIVTQYAPPDSVSPAGLRYVRRMGFDHEAFAAAVLHLAVLGALSIEEERGRAYTLKKRQASPTDLAPEEQALFQQLFKDGDELALKDSRYRTVGAAKEAALKTLRRTFERRYFVTNTGYFVPGALLSIGVMVAAGFVHSAVFGGMALFMCIWLTIWSLGVTGLGLEVVRSWRRVLATSGAVRGLSAGAALVMTLFALPFFAGEAIGLFFLGSLTSAGSVVILLLLVVVNAVFYHLLKAFTFAGRRFMDRVEGFREFLTRVEQERFKVLYPGGKTPALFEQFLPYALALGVEQAWASQFAEVLQGSADGRGGYAPSWYRGGSWSSSSPSGFASSLGGSLAGAIASASTAPGSSSGGGGGGSSGGGGGGGGGGGW